MLISLVGWFSFCTFLLYAQKVNQQFRNWMYEPGLHLKDKRNDNTRKGWNCDVLYSLSFFVITCSCVCHVPPLHILIIWQFVFVACGALGRFVTQLGGWLHGGRSSHLCWCPPVSHTEGISDSTNNNTRCPAVLPACMIKSQLLISFTIYNYSSILPFVTQIPLNCWLRTQDFGQWVSKTAR